MSNKIKKLINTKPFYFILGALIFGTIGVSAATYFPSNDVTYDNSTSGLSSTNVQGAIDELYSTCINPPEPAISPTDLLNKVVLAGDGLYKDEYESGRYCFKGANPDNYITFNNEPAGWRIVSVNSTGSLEIIDNHGIGIGGGNLRWNTSASNNWAAPASLNTYLNGEYYNGLTSNAKSKIVYHTWYIGAVTENNNNLSNQIADEKSKTWSGRVALPTASEFLRANSNMSQCGNIYTNNNNVNTCQNTNWMKLGNTQWSLTAVANKYNQVFELGSNTNVSYSSNYGINNKSRGVYPIVYLSSNILLRGSGTQSDPYEIVE